MSPGGRRKTLECVLQPDPEHILIGGGVRCSAIGIVESGFEQQAYIFIEFFSDQEVNLISIFAVKAKVSVVLK